MELRTGRGARRRGDESKGDETRGDESKGDETRGDESKGDETRGDESKGDETGCHVAKPSKVTTPTPGSCLESGAAFKDQAVLRSRTRRCCIHGAGSAAFMEQVVLRSRTRGCCVHGAGGAAFKGRRDSPIYKSEPLPVVGAAAPGCGRSLRPLKAVRSVRSARSVGSVTRGRASDNDSSVLGPLPPSFLSQAPPPCRRSCSVCLWGAAEEPETDRCSRPVTTAWSLCSPDATRHGRPDPGSRPGWVGPASRPGPDGSGRVQDGMLLDVYAGPLILEAHRRTPDQLVLMSLDGGPASAPRFPHRPHRPQP
ncbi:hypothetical protein EYF80_049052 [Liparis tanakae]|uniref:Uncharacterized protein n=1 Tax=Liparis tanakae TaxID=230148 RepID=A0A4Z2FJ34_9TELE|nr:hypothetical protein EYF80_049052 [Liparis tanakae]